MLNLTKYQLNLVFEQLESKIYELKKSIVDEENRDIREQKINFLRDYEDILVRISAEYRNA